MISSILNRCLFLRHMRSLEWCSRFDMRIASCLGFMLSRLYILDMHDVVL